MVLRGLRNWVQRRQVAEVYAGVTGSGAEMAWWYLSAERACPYISSQDILAITVAVYKRSDHIVPLLAQTLFFWQACRATSVFVIVALCEGCA